jgi:hypothetical protein
LKYERSAVSKRNNKIRGSEKEDEQGKEVVHVVDRREEVYGDIKVVHRTSEAAVSSIASDER